MSAKKRKGISKKVRFEVFKRDSFTCQYCGSTPPKVVLQVDHIVAVANGGDNDPDNLITACQPCNLGKSATPLESVPQSLKDKALETREREDQIRGYSEVMAERRERLESETWDALEEFMSVFDLERVLRDEFTSTKMFVERLGIDKVLWAMELALSRKSNHRTWCFKYFCGICWNVIRDGEDG